MPRESHVLVLAMAQPVERALALLQSEEGPHCSPSSTCPPVSGRSLHSWLSVGITSSRLSPSPVGTGADLTPAASPQIPRGSHL